MTRARSRPRPAPPVRHPSAPLELTIRISPQVRHALEQLARTGLYGWSAEDAAERLLCEQLRDVGDWEEP